MKILKNIASEGGHATTEYLAKLSRFIFSVENHNDDLGYRVKVFNILGFKFNKLNLPRLKVLDDFYVENKPVYLSIVAIAKNEAPYVKEWIEFHKLVGVERFYFYDNGSTDNTREVLEPYIKNGTVVYKYCEGQCLQNKVYADAILKYRNQTRWLAIIDLDEFIVPLEKDNIRDFLKDYEDFPAVGINWVMFDCNGHKTKPQTYKGMVTRNYTRALKNTNSKTNCQIKSIVNPQKVVSVFSPHYCIYKNKEFAVNENKEIIYGGFSEKHSSNKIQINHYYTKSEEEYWIKYNRGSADMLENRRVYNNEILNFPESEQNLKIQKYWEKLEKHI